MQPAFGVAPLRGASRTTNSMGKSNDRDLLIWQKARKLAVEVYRATQPFPGTETFGLTQQMQRTAISVPCNVAEGHGRRSSKDILHFLRIARGSLLELETPAIIATDLAFIESMRSEKLIDEVLDVVRLLNGLIRHY